MENKTETQVLDVEVLSHEAGCQCAPCKAFWWELFVVRDERSVMTGEVE
jgi:hypothetical protein